MQRTLTIAHRFHGPADAGNGGYVAGRLAALVGGPAEVTLRLPTPLDRPLQVERAAGGGIRLLDGEALLAEARPAEPELMLPAPVDFAAASAAGEVGRARQAQRNLFPTCFVCGPARAAGDGLRMLLGPVGDGLFAGPWRPHANFVGGDGTVDPVFVWSALDCPSAMAVSEGREEMLLLGRITGRIARCPRPGEATVVMAWALGHDGRRSEAASALFDADGACLARARALWFHPKPGF
jgi:hypothetical protein